MRKTVLIGAIPEGKNWCLGWLEDDYYEMAGTETVVRVLPCIARIQPNLESVPHLMKDI